MEIHEKSLEAMRGHLHNIYENLYMKGLYPVAVTMFDDFGKFANEVLKNKEKRISLQEVVSIVLFPVIEEIIRSNKNPKDISGKLVEIVSAEKIKEIEDNIIDLINDIPKEYEIFFWLPNCDDFFSEEIVISNSVKLIKISKENSRKVNGFSSNPMTQIFGDKNEQFMPIDGVYIYIKTSGFFRDSIENSAVRFAFSRLKQVVITGLSEKVFRQKNIINDFGVLPKLCRMFVFENDYPSSVGEELRIPENIASFLSSISINHDYIQESVKENPIYKIPPEADPRLKFITLSFYSLRKLLESPEDDENVDSLKNAYEWLFESYVNDNQTFAFVQLCIGVEAILGDNTFEESLTKTLADRCAYLLGNTKTTRNSIREAFMKFYRMRSKLVHGRKIRLDESELNFYNYGKSILHKLIQEELKNLYKS